MASCRLRSRHGARSATWPATHVHLRPPVEGSVVKQPRLPSMLEPLDLATVALRPDDLLSDFEVSAGTLAGVRIEGLAMRTGRLHHVDFRGAVLERLELMDVCLVDCDLANVEFRQCSMHRVQFDQCRLTGAQFPAATTQDLLLRNCIGKLSQFRFAQLPACHFDKCDLQDADFQGSDLTGTVFSGCDLRNVEMSQAKLAGVDLRSCTIDGLRASPDGLKGLIIEPHQAPTVAALLGVEIRWP